MTVANPNNKVQYDGDGSNTVFGFSFQLPLGSTGSDIQIFVTDPTGVQTQIVNNYSLDLNAKTVTYPVIGQQAPLGPGQNALPNGWTIDLVRVEPLTQNLNLTTQGSFTGVSMMNALDIIVMMIQQMQEQINRCVKYPINEVANTTDVNAFIAAVNAIIAPPPLTGTYAYCKAVVAINPSVPRNCIVTDQGTPETNQLFWYSGIPSLGDTGFFGPLAGV